MKLHPKSLAFSAVVLGAVLAACQEPYHQKDEQYYLIYGEYQFALLAGSRGRPPGRRSSYGRQSRDGWPHHSLAAGRVRLLSKGRGSPSFGDSCFRNESGASQTGDRHRRRSRHSRDLHRCGRPRFPPHRVRWNGQLPRRSGERQAHGGHSQGSGAGRHRHRPRSAQLGRACPWRHRSP